MNSIHHLRAGGQPVLPARSLKCLLLTTFWLTTISMSGNVTISEDFATNPLLRDWSVFGDTNLFRWNATNQNLEVTWDSSRSNSYFHLPLGNILARADDFS